jgi:hypothetical protein
MGNRSIFREAFMAAPSSRRPFAAKPITLAVYSYDIPPEALGDWLKSALPDGYTGTSPRVVKVIDGEYLCYADGTAQFVPLGRTAGDRVPI